MAEPLERRALLSTTYDAVADFSSTSNPNGVWSYGTRATIASPFVAFPESGGFDIGDAVQGWHDAGTSSPPYVGINTTAAPVSGLTVTVPTGVLDMHPGSDGTYSDVEFTANFAGPVTVTAVFSGIDVGGTTTDVHVLHNGAAIADGDVNGYGDVSTVAPGPLAVTVAVGDTIDFVVGFGTNGSYNSDSTSLAANITTGTAGPAKSIGALDPTFGNNGLASHDVGFTSTTGVAADGTQSVLVGPTGASPGQAFGVTRYNADGSLDATFGTAGVTTTPFAGLDAVPSAVAVLASGDILVGGTAATFAPDGTVAGSQFAVAEYTASGVLDPTFGVGGTMTMQFGAALSNDVLRALAVGPGGLIYLGGSSDVAGKGNADLAVARLTPAGALDATFNSTGTVTVDVAGGDDVVNSLAVQSNGEVVAAGSATVSGTAEVALARFLTTGGLDKRFGTKGITTAKVGGVYDAAQSVAVQPKGQIVVGGLTASGSGDALTSDFLVQRYTSAGRLDRSFATGGTAVTSFGQPAAVTQLALQGDGSITASGRTSATLGGTLDVAIARYTTRGVLDTSFAGTGKVVIDLSVGVVASPALRAAISSDLGAAFDAFTSSSQGVVAVTSGGEILSAGNSGANTVEAELVAAGINLVATLLSTLPASVLGGTKGTVTVSLTEGGTTRATGAITITLAFATDAAGTGATVVRTLPAKVNLGQGQSKSFRLAFAYPAGASSGNYFALATVTDGAGLSTELNPDDNVAASPAPVTVAPAFVALTGSALSATALSPGGLSTVGLTLANAGNVTAKGKTDVAVYLSTDGTVANGTQVGDVALTVGLAAGKSHPYRLKFALPSTVAAGTYTLVAVVDRGRTLGATEASVGAAVEDDSPVTVG